MTKFPPLNGCLTFPGCVCVSLCSVWPTFGTCSSLPDLPWNNLGFQCYGGHSDNASHKGSHQKADTVICAHMYSVYVGFEPLISWLRWAYHIDQCPLDSHTGRDGKNRALSNWAIARFSWGSSSSVILIRFIFMDWLSVGWIPSMFSGYLSYFLNFNILQVFLS